MGNAAPQRQDEFAGVEPVDPAESLTVILQAVARDAGYDVNRDDLTVALGLAWSAIAVPGENDLGSWSLYARDVFLREVGPLFGMTIRGIHPPEAARGLHDSAEFAQHFDASYRPLILRALEHDQPVLAWQGWAGDYRMMWGIITKPCTGGVGLTGEVPGASSARTERDDRSAAMLERPPVQLYVVEAMAVTQPQPRDVLALALEHAAQVLNNVLQDRLGILTGPPAYDAWIEKLRGAEGAGHDSAGVISAHNRLAKATRGAHETVIRFLQRQPVPAGERRTHVEAIVESLQRIVGSLYNAMADETNRSPSESADLMATALCALKRAREATLSLRDALSCAPSNSPTDAA